VIKNPKANKGLIVSLKVVHAKIQPPIIAYRKINNTNFILLPALQFSSSIKNKLSQSINQKVQV